MTVISAGKVYNVSGSASASNFGVYGEIRVYGGGQATGTQVYSAGTEEVKSGGIDYNATVSFGGVQSVTASGQANHDVIYGSQLVYSGGQASFATVHGTQTISSGGEALNSLVASGVVLNVGGTLYMASAGQGGQIDVSRAGHDISTQVFAGGREIVESKAIATHGLIAAGGSQYIFKGGTVTGEEIAGVVQNYGTESASHIDAGGISYLLVTGSSLAESIGSGGRQILLSGKASGTVIAGGGVQTVSSGGLATTTLVLSGGAEAVRSGGTDIGSQISNGGHETISAGGIASASHISNGGREYVSGGIDRYAVISSGGMAFIYSAGVISNTTLLSGATVTVSSGGLVRDGLTISGGKAIISGTVEAGQNVVFAGSGVLALANTDAFAASIGGFAKGDVLDLRQFAYGAGETLSFTEAAGLSSGTLTITDGAQTVGLTLLGDHTGTKFTLSADAASGTYVKIG